MYAEKTPCVWSTCLEIIVWAGERKEILNCSPSVFVPNALNFHFGVDMQMNWNRFFFCYLNCISSLQFMLSILCSSSLLFKVLWMSCLHKLLWWSRNTVHYPLYNYFMLLYNASLKMSLNQQWHLMANTKLLYLSRGC